MGVLMGSFLTFSLKLYFETLMVRCFKNSGNILSRKPRIPLDGKNTQKYLDHVVDFQTAFKMCLHLQSAQKLKEMTDIHQNKIE